MMSFVDEWYLPYRSANHRDRNRKPSVGADNESSTPSPSSESIVLALAVLVLPQKAHRPLLITTLAPSFPKTPASRGFGLRARPPLRLRKPNMPVGLPPLVAAAPRTPSAGKVALLSASSAHEPVSPSTTCLPPLLLLVLLVPARSRCG